MEEYKEFKKKMKTKFNNTVEFNSKDFDLENNFYHQVRDLKVEKDTIILDGETINLPSKNIIIIINGNVDTVSSDKDIIIGGDVENVEVNNLECGDVYSNITAKKVVCKDVEGNISCNQITCVDVEGKVNINIDEKNNKPATIKMRDLSNSLTITNNSEKLVETNIKSTESNIKASKCNFNIDGSVEGNITNGSGEGSFTIKGDIEGNLTNNGNATISIGKNVYSAVSTKGDIECKGDIEGNAKGKTIVVGGEVYGETITTK